MDAPVPPPASAPAPAPPAAPVAPPADPQRIQREHDSLDDFEHLDHDPSPAKDIKPIKDEPAPAPAIMHESEPEPEPILVSVPVPSKVPEPVMPQPPQPPQPPQREADLLMFGSDSPAKVPSKEAASRAAQSFLDTEREEVLVAAPHIVQDDPHFADSREELSPAPSDDSLPDAVENFASPPSPARVPAVAPPPSPPVVLEEPIVPQIIPPPEEEEEEEEEAYSPPPPPVETAPAPPPRPVTEAEAIFCQMGLDAWFNPGRLHPKVESLVYWRSPAKSGVALGAGLALLLALACCSLISVLAYTSLLALTATTAFRIYCCILQAVQKTSDGHPFKDLLETDVSVSPERAQELAVLATAHLNAAASELRRLFLVEDLVDSLKFGVSLWCLTYLGAWFNGMTLLIIGYVALFTLPKVYETNKAQIDANMDLVSTKFQEITNKVKAAIPIGKKGESEKDK